MPDRNGKIFYTSITSLSHISKELGIDVPIFLCAVLIELFQGGINSYEAQIAYYTEAIAKNPNWTFAGIYADEGITGTATTKRKDFLRLMRDCEKGKVDFILTKSVSRFARNTVDSLMWTRKLRAKGIGVYFEEQAIDSLKAENEMLIGLFSVIAQSESENISANVKWGVQQRMRSGTYMTNFNCYGYR